MKCKNGLDLCGFQLTNFCVQGEASAPSDAALGRKYFHTNATDDVATGISLLHRERIYLGEGAWRATAYLDDIAAIQTKLDMILGDVDLDGVIENMNEVIKFLEDNKDTENLMTLLNGKLNTSGGTINGILAISSSSVPLIQFKKGTTTLSNLICYSATNWAITDGTWSNEYTLIHSGNIGSYKAGGLRTSAGADAVTIDSDKNAYFENIIYGKSQPIVFKNGNDNVAYFGAAHSTISSTLDGVGIMARGTRGIYFSTNGSVQAIINSSGNVTIGGSDLARTNAKLYVDGVINTTDNINIYGGYLSLRPATNVYGDIEMTSSRMRIQAMHEGVAFLPISLNPLGGNVLIGTTTDSGEKLQVAGKASFTDRLYAPYIFMGKGENGIYIHKAGISWHNSANSYVTDIAYFASDAVEFRKPVTIAGDLHVKGNIISDKEVSAGGAGTEESTSGSGSAEGVSEIFTPTSTSMAFDHNLGEDVIVQVYEKSGNVWNMVMVDTEITSATKVTLRFGKTETTQHKVVIMGV